MARGERVAQTVSHEVEAQHRQEDERTGIDGRRGVVQMKSWAFCNMLDSRHVQPAKTVRLAEEHGAELPGGNQADAKRAARFGPSGKI